MAQSQPKSFPYAYDVVFDALVQVLPSCNMNLERADKAEGVIAATTKVGLMTWGEKVGVRVGAEGPDSTTVVVQSDLKFGLVAWGKHEKNFTKVFTALEGELARQADQASG